MKTKFDDDAYAAAIAFRCPAELRKAVEELAAVEGLHMSAFVKRATMIDVKRRRRELADDAA